MFLFFFLFFISIVFSNKNFFIKDNNIYYKVQNGDNYSKISAKILVPYSEIISINKKKKLYKDRVILLPNYFYYSVKKGDSFYKIIKNLNLADKKNTSKSWKYFFSSHRKKKLFYGKKIKIPISFVLLKKTKKENKKIQKKK